MFLCLWTLFFMKPNKNYLISKCWRSQSRLAQSESICICFIKFPLQWTVVRTRLTPRIFLSVAIQCAALILHKMLARLATSNYDDSKRFLRQLLLSKGNVAQTNRYLWLVHLGCWMHDFLWILPRYITTNSTTTLQPDDVIQAQSPAYARWTPLQWEHSSHRPS